MSMGGSYIPGSFGSQNVALQDNGVKKAGPGGRSSVSNYEGEKAGFKSTPRP